MKVNRSLRLALLALIVLALPALEQLFVPDSSAQAAVLDQLSSAGNTLVGAAPKPKTPRPTKTPAPPPPDTPTATTSPTPTDTQTPGPSPAPTDTSAPTDTPTPMPTATETPLPTPTLPNDQVPKIYWGVNLAGGMDAVPAWEVNVAANPVRTAPAQKGISIFNYGHFWGDAGGYNEFDEYSLPIVTQIRAHGAIPMISWTPEGGKTTWRLQDIAGGAHNDYIVRFATQLKAWGNPVFLRMMHEMNGNWGWAWQVKKGDEQVFVDAWRQIVKIFREVGATNASFVWCPNVEYAGSPWATFDALWPETKVGSGTPQWEHEVDWTCLDGYNKYGGQSWLTFDEVFRYSYNEIVNSAKINQNNEQVGEKPLMIGEWGSIENSSPVENTDTRPEWFADALEVQLRNNFPRIRAVVYYHHTHGSSDWEFDYTNTIPSAQAWSDGILQPWFTSNTFGDFVTSPIPAP